VLEQLLEELARWLAPHAIELELVSTQRGSLARWSVEQARRTSGRSFRVPVPEMPDWQLVTDWQGSTATAVVELERAAMVLGVWGLARPALTEAEQDLAERVAELNLLQLLGRRASEARTAEQLFVGTAGVLDQAAELDLLFGVYFEERTPVGLAFLNRPVAPIYLQALLTRVGRFLGPAGEGLDIRRCFELDGHDEAREPCEHFRDQDLILLPLLRHGRPSGCLCVVPAQEMAEPRLRLLYGAVNELSLHLDRILTLREAEAGRFRSIVESMPHGVILTDARLDIVRINRAGRAMLEREGLPAEGSAAALLTHLGLPGLVQQALADGTRSAEGEVHREGERTWSVSAAPLLGERERSEGLVLTVSDITESRRFQQQLAHADKLSSLGQMISGIVHELNNPLATILGYAQLLHGRTADPQLQQRLGLMRREAERCRRIVQSLLSFARHSPPERKLLSLNQSVRDVVSLIAYQLEVDGIEVATALDAELPSIQGDPHQIEQALINLLSNAQQAMRQQGQAGRIEVQSRRDAEGWVVLEVRDNGPGIPTAIRSKIFDPFFTTKGAEQGTGLGLALVHGIVTSHGGKIELLAEQAGAAFRLSFPAGTPQARASVEPATPAPEHRRARILVVDDEEPLARLLCEALAADGHETIWARDGRQALGHLGRERFDLVLSDLKMPGMDGVRLFEELCRAHPRLSRSMLLTSGDTVGERPQRLAAALGLEVLHKPFDLAELLCRVQQHLSRG
jgi:signal transduction histidine kinase/CheY-like chemotaxis protein